MSIWPTRRLLIRVTGLPVNGDLEDGFGPEPSDVEATIEAAIKAGLAGVGIEDTTANPDRPIHDFDKAVARVQAAAKVAKGRILLTGRTDNFIQGRPDLDDTIKRLVAFAEVGADVLYAPYPTDMDAVRAIVRAVAPKPINLVVGTMQGAAPWAEVQAAGVRRLSLGVALYTRVMGNLAQAAAELLSGDLATGSGDKPSTSVAIAFGQLHGRMDDFTMARVLAAVELRMAGRREEFPRPGSQTPMARISARNRKTSAPIGEANRSRVTAIRADQPRQAARSIGPSRAKPRRPTVPELIAQLESPTRTTRANAAKHLLREFRPHDPSNEHPELIEPLSRILRSGSESCVRHRRRLCVSAPTGVHTSHRS